ncbi:MAG: hypothetical protein NDI75_08935 [Candidatus Didemnitutus sp.]|nr:hypothetical protein [Candidatus Didemnitutus sp.]
MKLGVLSLLFVAVTAFVRAEEADFSHAISAQEFKAAGLDRLSLEERRELDRLVQSFKHGEIAAAQKQAAGAREAQRSAEAAAAAAKQAARVAKEEAEAAKIKAAEKTLDQGFFAKAKVLVVPGTNIEYAEIRSTINGPFEGWMGKTIFQLANGQRWQVVNHGDRYFTPPEENVEVQIRPAALGGFWMEVPHLRVRVRVKLIDQHR